MPVEEFLKALGPPDKAAPASITLPSRMIKSIDEIASARDTTRSGVVRDFLAPLVKEWDEMPASKRKMIAQEAV